MRNVALEELISSNSNPKDGGTISGGMACVTDFDEEPDEILSRYDVQLKQLNSRIDLLQAEHDNIHQVT